MASFIGSAGNEIGTGHAVATAVIVGGDVAGWPARSFARPGTGVRVVRHLSIAEAERGAEPLGGADVVVLDVRGLDDERLAGALDALAKGPHRAMAQMIVLLETPQIDPVAAAAMGPRVQLLCDPSEVDCLVALSLASSVALDGARDRSEEAERLKRLNAEVQRIAETLARLTEPEGNRSANTARDATRGFGAPPSVATGDSAVRPGEVRGLIRARRMRDSFFEGTLFADPAWDMLLDLFAAELEHARVSVSSLCIAAAVPGTTALRWIGTLTEAGLIERRDDPFDRRRAFISLSARASAAMRNYFAGLRAAGLMKA